MQRKLFIKFGLAMSSFLTAPFCLNARTGWWARNDKGFKVDAGKDRFNKSSSPVNGIIFYTKVSTKDTDGNMCVFESTLIKEGGPPLHTHYNIDEFWYVLQGEFIFRVGDRTYNAKAGDLVFGPRNVPHTFAKLGLEEAKLLIGYQPAGKMEEYFRKISEEVYKNMSETEKDNLGKEHGIERVGPPLT
jgi:mannose-6-phosphate isomerase-like protein (cupin superfamily)